MTISMNCIWFRSVSFIVSMTIITSTLIFISSSANARFTGAIERSAARAAASAAERKAAQRATKNSSKSIATRQTSLQATDRIVRRWHSVMCQPRRPCPLPPNVANSFKGGSYNEVMLGKDTLLYRVYSDPARRMGRPGNRFTYWSRSDARGTQAVMDSAINVSKFGNNAKDQVVIRIPRGTRVYEGKTQSIPRGGPIGGGNQVVVDDVKPEWIMNR